MVKIILNGKLLNGPSDRERFGDGFLWRRGPLLGKGGFASVFLALTKTDRPGFLPSYMAVKSALASRSSSLVEEKQVLTALAGCPNIIAFFGEETTKGCDDTVVYNLLLEYGSGGTLLNRIRMCGGKIPEVEVRSYTRSILQALEFVHELGYVHCDLKPENVLLVRRYRKDETHEYEAKLCDFGLAKRACENGKKRKRPHENWRGTPMYLSPEAVKDGVQERPSDIWSLGCTVLEMLTGKAVWGVGEEEEDRRKKILDLIRKDRSVPNIPDNLSPDAKSFLRFCLRRMIQNRLSAKTLLSHPFVDFRAD